MRSIPIADGLGREVARLKGILESLGRRRSLRDPLSSACAKIDLTSPQIHALSWLGRGALTMGALARLLGITEKTATGVIDRLEREGYLLRRRDGKDRRVVHVQLTRKGQAIARRLDGLVTEKLGQLLSLIDAPSRRDLFRILEQLLANLPDPA